MNYNLHYTRLIDRARARTLPGYKEKHHIVPRCMGGTNDPANLVELTAREHFIAHLLLLKIYPNKKSLIKAVNLMCLYNEKQDRSLNKMYGWLKEKFATEMSRSQKGHGNSQFGSIWISNIELRTSKKISKSVKIPAGWQVGRIVDFDKYIAKQFKKELKEAKKKSSIDQKNQQKNQTTVEKEKYKESILKLYDQFKSGNYYSVRDFHTKNNLQVSRMTLTNYWTKWIPEYKEKSKEGKRFTF
jgi:mRNA-degrading endonuclease YafQ of YafQ-DinJ toxin-antitoxin module